MRENQKCRLDSIQEQAGCPGLTVLECPALPLFDYEHFFMRLLITGVHPHAQLRSQLLGD
jgi:hypothetical protein